MTHGAVKKIEVEHLDTGVGGPGIRDIYQGLYYPLYYVKFEFEVSEYFAENSEMRFRFCGDQDCPDWALAEITTLSKITSVKMKLLCAQVIKDMLGDELDYGKVQRLTSDAKFTAGDVKGSIAALQFILSSSAKHCVDEESLSREIQQLGLPREHTVALCKLYGENFNPLRDILQQKSLRLSSLDDVKWRVDYVIGSSYLNDVSCPMTRVNIKIRSSVNDELTMQSFNLTPTKLRVFLSELKQLHDLMETI